MCSGRAVAISEVAEILLARAKRPMRLVLDRDRLRPVDVPVHWGDNTRLREATGWQPDIPLEHSLADVLDCSEHLVYRLNFAPTPFAARQLINHGHVMVNGRRVNIPSYHVREGDVVEIRDRSKQLVMVLEAIQQPERDVPDYLSVDYTGVKGTFVRTPKLADVPYPVQMEPHLVIEFYSR